MKLFPSKKPLLFRILLLLMPLTIVFWLILYIVSQQFLEKAMMSSFTESMLRMMKSISVKTATDIKYGDYFEIKRTLRDFYDEDLMRYLVIYTSDMKPLGIFPSQIDGRDMMFLEDMIKKNSQKPFSTDFIEHSDEPFYHFQLVITDETGQRIGYLAIGGTTIQLATTMKTISVVFSVFLILFLAMQISAIVYAVYILTKPLTSLTKILQQTEGDEPAKFLPALISMKTPKGASSEIDVFFKAYQRLLKNIHNHELNEKELAIAASIGSVASHLAHDIRSPLSVLTNFVSFVPPIDDESIERLRDSSRRSIERLTDMVNDLLDYAKAQQISPKQIVMRLFVKNVVTEFTPQAVEKEVTIKFNCPDDLVGRLDEAKMERVVGNIVLNAIQAIEKKPGEIIINIIKREDEWLAIEISDNGGGISPEHLPRIFESTFTFGKPKGSGLGLSYCKNVVASHGGRIEVTSELGKGTTFTVAIPQITISGFVASTAEPQDNIMTPVIESASNTVLIVDDDEDILATWRVLIRNNTHYELVTASSPKEVMQMEIPPDLYRGAVVDFHFEGSDKNGIDVVKYLKSCKVPVIYMCTGYYYDPELNIKAKAAGANAVLPKPINEGTVKQLFG